MPLQKIAFIVNPISGKGKQNNIHRLIDRYLDVHKFDFEIFRSEYSGHMKIIALEAVSKGFQIIIAIGGDGSINEIFPGLIGTDVIFGIIPKGSGNGLARFLNIPLNPQKAIQLINQLPVQKIDTAEINGRPFISIAGLGFDAHVAELFSEHKKRGFWSYLKITFKTYFAYDEKKYILRLNDDEEKELQAMMICFANSDQFGNNVRISPKANINDGLIDVCVVNKLPFWTIPFNLFLVFTGLVEKSNYYKRYQARKLSVKSNEKQMVNIDGEPIQMGTKIELKMHPSSIRIISPKN